MVSGISWSLKEHCGLEPPALVVVGVSGGPDSLCLMHALHRLGYAVVAAHLDHMLRAESATDAETVRVVADGLGIPFVLQRADVGARARAEGKSVEEAGRAARYELLFDEARKRSAAAVAVGHTADDQAETVLMHLIRGAGVGGLRGMRYRSILPSLDSGIPLIRPLLGAARAETSAYCSEEGLQPVHDRTNESLDYFRNRVRHELLPVLESYNPRVREALLRTAESMSADYLIIEARIAEAWRQTLIERKTGLVAFDSARLGQLSQPVRRRTLMRGIEALAPAADVGYAALNAAADFCIGPGSSRMELGGGLLLVRDPAAVYLALDEAAVPDGSWPQLPQAATTIEVGGPMSVALDKGWRFEARYESVRGDPLDLIPPAEDLYCTSLDADALPRSLQLRRPRPGDRIAPLGLDGHSQKISDIFVNEKVPGRLRERWPLLASNGTLVWVPGYRPAEEYRLRRETRWAAHFCVSHPAASEP